MSIQYLHTYVLYSVHKCIRINAVNILKIKHLTEIKSTVNKISKTL